MMRDAVLSAEMDGRGPRALVIQPFLPFDITGRKRNIQFINTEWSKQLCEGLQ